jgi:hypothetical protein
MQGNREAKRRRIAGWAATIALSGLLAFSAPIASGAKVRVGLTVRGAGAGLTVGSYVVLTAKAKLPKGDRLQIRRHASNSRVWHLVAECRTSPCTTPWVQRGPSSVAVTFAARVVHRKGGTGRVDAVPGTSKAIVVTWYPLPPPPPPPLPPPVQPPRPPVALAGSYCGLNDQTKSTCIEVGSTGSTVIGFATDLTISCTVGFHWQVRPTINDVTPINTDLSFGYSYSSTVTGVSPTSNIVTKYTIAGRLDTEGNASGTITVDAFSWEQNGNHVTCSGVTIGWRAQRVS